MSDETRRVLDLLAQNKITVDEADQLLRAVATASSAPADAGAASTEAEPRKPRFIRIAVHKAANERRPSEDVNIRVPIAVVRSGMRLGAVLPGFIGEKVTARLRERGLDLDLSKLDPAAIETILAELGDVAIDVESGKAQVRVSCE